MKNARLLGLVVISVLGLIGCSSSPVKVDVEAADFKILEAAPGGRETWLDTPQVYADDHGLDVKQNYFYTGESRSADKRMACEKAQANVLDDIAKQVATFTDTSIARASSESAATDTNLSSGQSQVSEETQRISSQLAKAQLNNVVIKKTYWERRDYTQGGGAKNLYLCWALASIGKKEVNDLVLRASTMKLSTNPELKERVDDKLQGIDKKYEEWQKTH